MPAAVFPVFVRAEEPQIWKDKERKDVLAAGKSVCLTSYVVTS